MDGMPFNVVDEDYSDEEETISYHQDPPKLSMTNDAMGLDMLIGGQHYDEESKEENVDAESDTKTNVFMSSDDDASDEDETLPKKEDTTFKPSNVFMSGSPHVRSTEDINREKSELLYQFDRMEKKGIKLPRVFSMDSSLDEMKATFDRMRRDRELDASMKFSKNALMAIVTGIETLNTRFDPFDIHLEGWSETVHESVDDYEEIFEELHHKYKGTAKMAPELRLMMSLAGSAFMYNITNTMFKGALPGAKDVMRQNPGLQAQFAKAAVSSMGSEKANGLLSSMMGGPAPVPPPRPRAGGMSGPSDLDNIIASLESTKSDRLETMSTATPSEISEMTETNSIRNLLGDSTRKPRKPRSSSKRTINI